MPRQRTPRPQNSPVCATLTSQRDYLTVKAKMTFPSQRDQQVLSPCTAVIAARVRAARDRAARRLSGTPWRANAGIPADALGAFPADRGDHDWHSQYAGNRHFRCRTDPADLARRRRAGWVGHRAGPFWMALTITGPGSGVPSRRA
jgi:hypothetical protein